MFLKALFIIKILAQINIFKYIFYNIYISYNRHHECLTFYTKTALDLKIVKKSTRHVKTDVLRNERISFKMSYKDRDLIIITLIALHL